MKTFIITYNFNVYRPSDIYTYNRQSAFKLELEAENIETVKDILKNEYNLNPTYFTIKN
jgi:hypothetical protein